MIRTCPDCRTDYHANGRHCQKCGNAHLHAVVAERLRISALVPRCCHAEPEIARAAADLSDEYARAG